MFPTDFISLCVLQQNPATFPQMSPLTFQKHKALKFPSEFKTKTGFVLVPLVLKIRDCLFLLIIGQNKPNGLFTVPGLGGDAVS